MPQHTSMTQPQQTHCPHTRPACCLPPCPQHIPSPCHAPAWPPTWHESPPLAVVLPPDEAHELAHGVAVVVGRPEGVLRHSPAGREDDEVSHRHACRGGGMGGVGGGSGGRGQAISRTKQLGWCLHAVHTATMMYPSQQYTCAQALPHMCTGTTTHVHRHYHTCAQALPHMCTCTTTHVHRHYHTCAQALPHMLEQFSEFSLPCSAADIHVGHSSTLTTAAPGHHMLHSTAATHLARRRAP
jgi:hypothetical protein